MWIDTHCHLDAAEFEADRDTVMQTALANGVEKIVIPAVEQANFKAVLEVCQRYPQCMPALGMHPMYIHKHRPEHLQLLRDAIAQFKPVAVGEIGLDFFVPDLDPAIQEHYFVEQLKIAKEFDLPVLLHVRRANDQILKQLRRYRVKGGIAHAFNGSQQQANELIKLGFKLGFGGTITYSRALNLRRLVVDLPIEAIVLETDAPDMPPSFAYKQRNSPEYLPQIALEIATLREMELAEFAAMTLRNACEVLGLTN
ncbi:TatD family hydrolase [Sulfurirhabdus autotrophica]|uniref:TatD DNase family protein n=1 Tax=Sulfurirhabdus autotrophica TaxID=1706046 RepID=A0A4R3XYF5_9PROT|nr:TatD family hydrolase [Sulfurirhabdus autotrophica]TCV84097.1 TatD DNase family protein [Sulfurirhabdus autotrophica]